MEIKELVKRINGFKRMRNLLEMELDTFTELGRKASAEAQAEIDNRDRAGLSCSHVSTNSAYWEDLNKGVGQLEYGIKYLNEGIGLLEASYRRAIRFKDPVEYQPEQEKKPE